MIAAHGRSGNETGLKQTYVLLELLEPQSKDCVWLTCIILQPRATTENITQIFIGIIAKTRILQ